MWEDNFGRPGSLLMSSSLIFVSGFIQLGISFLIILLPMSLLLLCVHVYGCEMLRSVLKSVARTRTENLGSCHSHNYILYDHSNKNIQRNLLVFVGYSGTVGLMSVRNIVHIGSHLHCTPYHHQVVTNR